ncbi:uncharacterized protein A1O9_04693 [Exophiala aquamarina CBS 119918]|uniref:Uncharacterized protein n=1 Tax=Exophiala aquamarina CBS 119918 TaxID=1182545 RepID=A0A072PWA0_9EURO|nr:uncharacterized protein A1O9_04693 [Exophiala aquamarina CBS 119918]KEF59845.1 hypothetical protein A1O9_04693 [Exophiala aquamarina CBS 119918]
MATRRPAAQQGEKTIAEAQGGPSTADMSSDTTPAVPAHVIYKLLFFTAAMVCVPLGSYFFTLSFVFRGNASYAGGFAAVMANVVLIGYIIAAVKEDQSDKIEEKRKKGQ